MDTQRAIKPLVRMPAAGTLRMLANFAGFQLGWFACVLGAAQGHGLAGAAAAAVIVVAHVAMARQRLGELYLVLIAVLLGAAFDSALAATGWIVYHDAALGPLAPPWILALWALFAITLNTSLAWLQRRRAVAALLGAVAGPLSYWAGVRLGALEFVFPLAAVSALALGWCLMTPLLSGLAQRLHDRGERA